MKEHTANLRAEVERIYSKHYRSLSGACIDMCERILFGGESPENDNNVLELISCFPAHLD